MGVDRGEVEPSGDEEDHGFHRLEAGVSTRLAFGGLEQAVDGFDKAIGLAGLGPGDDPIEMTADHDGDLLHRPDLGAQDVSAPLLEHGGYDVDLLAVENVAQLLAIEPCARCALGSEVRDQPVKVSSLLVRKLASVLEQRPAQPFERGIGLLLQAPHLVNGLAGVSNDVEFVEGDPGIRQLDRDRRLRDRAGPRVLGLDMRPISPINAGRTHIVAAPCESRLFFGIRRRHELIQRENRRALTR
jgi:hypothetical protein